MVLRGILKNPFCERKGRGVIYDSDGLICIYNIYLSDIISEYVLCLDEARVVTQMQYLSWPDHGTPDDSKEFVDFCYEVRMCVIDTLRVHMCGLLELS